MQIPELNKYYSYSQYKNFVNECVQNNRTSGSEQLPERIEATKLNIVRMNRLDKQIEIDSQLKNTVQQLTGKYIWILLTEAWCGDGAQNIPVIAKIAALNPNIDFKIILRDENPEIMDRYLTNGARSVPKLICFDAASGKELGTWGARPSKIQSMVKEFKAANPNVSHDDFVKELHLWYAKDKGTSLQEDFFSLIKKWGEI